MPNPYDPQNPAKPDYFGGREEVLSVVRERINRASSQRQSGGVLIYGHRGVGKTSLLNKLVDVVSFTGGVPSNNLVIYRRLSRTTSDSELYQILTESLLEQVDARKSFLQRFGAAVSSVSVKAFEVELTASRGPEVSRSQYSLWASTLRGLSNAAFILMALDDADYLSPEALGELKTIVEGPNPTPILLVVSGGVEFQQRLVDEYSPIARVFSGADFNIGKFTSREVGEVLEKPLANENTSWAQGAIAELNKLTGGYPYLVQCLASASYLEGEEITAERVSGAVSRAVEIGRAWLDREIPRASDQDVLSFARISSGLTGEIIRSSEMSVRGVSAPYIGRLVQLGVLKQVSRGRYSLQKSPMIATYQMLKRGLSISP